MSWESAIDFVLKHEGGFCDDPADPGGATNLGISLRFLKGMGFDLGDIDGDGDIDADDIRAMTREKAVSIYRATFWDAPGLDGIPRKIAVAVFDTAVNMGTSRAVKNLQVAINNCATLTRLKVDGDLGPRTRASAHSVPVRELLYRYMLQRIFLYNDICRNNTTLRKFMPGWLNRVQDLDRLLEA